jgi:hypothetical protein
MLSPLVSSAVLTNSGLVARKFDGAIASTICRVMKRMRSLAWPSAIGAASAMRFMYSALIR